MGFNVNEHLISLKGKDYLQVMWRLVWFREEKPNWSIETQLVKLEDKQAVFQAKILNEEGRQIASGYGSETPNDFKDFIEKAETKAIGRALAMLGYGTQFAPELDEGERVVDSPVEKPLNTSVWWEEIGKLGFDRAEVEERFGCHYDLHHLNREQANNIYRALEKEAKTYA